MSRSALADGIRHLRSKMAAQQHRDDSDEQLLHAFTTRRDEAAFAVLVRRHGPMVLQICRRTLGHEQDAEDAFQATFLVLARNAAALRKQSSLAGFLHGIAYRTALKARQAAARRRKHESSLGPPTQLRAPADPADELSWREAKELLDEEIARLPDIYRSVFVLFYMENLNREETARRLGLKAVTVAKRLAEARKRLKLRLIRRGVELTAVLAATAVAMPPVSALPIGLTATIIEAALAMTADEKWAAVVSPSVAEFVQCTMKALIASKVKLVTVLLAGVLLTAATSGALVNWYARTSAPFAATSAAKPASRSLGSEQKPRLEINGRVLDPDGKPVRGAKLLLLCYFSEENLHKKIWAISDGEGRFRISVPRALVDKSGWSAYVMAAAEGHGFAAAKLNKGKAADLTLRLVKDDGAIRGRILDLQGRPVAGARIRIGNTLYVPKQGDLTAWLAALKDPKRSNIRWWADYLTDLDSPAFDLLFPPVTTGADGRFCIKGIGRERVTELRIEGPTIATQGIQVMTRAQQAIYLPDHVRWHPKRRPVGYFGADFDIAAPPTRPVVGVVRDKDTGRPLAGVTIKSVLTIDESKYDFLRTVTDKEGRYRLTGLPKGDYNEVAAITNDFSSPTGNDLTQHPAYLPAVKKVANPRGIDPVTVDFVLKRGVWVKGRITGKSTGKSQMATVKYFCFDNNPDAEELLDPHYLFPYNLPWTDQDGSFLLPALPGRGVIAASAHEDHYIRGVGAARIKDIDPKQERDTFSTFPHRCHARDFHALVEINPKSGDGAITCNIALESGRSQKGTVLGPDGKPLAGVRISGLNERGRWKDIGTEFTVESLQPNKPRVLQFVHQGKKLAGAFVLRGNEKKPISVRLEPWGALTGRLLSPKGEPLAGKPMTGAEVRCWARRIQTGKDGHSRIVTLDDDFPLATVRTDNEGRFRIEGLAAGLRYDLVFAKEDYVRHIDGGDPEDLTIKTGETKDLGDLRVRPVGE